MDDVTDDDLVRLFCDGDADAFDVLFDRHYACVYNFARVMLLDDSAAEEVLQESFLAAAQAAKRYQPAGRFRSWLLRIVRNRCLNRLAALRARKVLLAEISLGTMDPPGPQREPSRLLEDGEAAAAVRAAIDALPDRQREAIALFAMERMKYHQIAEVLDVPVNTVKTLIHRARAALAASLGKHDLENGRDL